jgi:hypothetical protein
MTIWHIVCSFGTFFPLFVSCTKKNLATLARFCFKRHHTSRTLFVFDPFSLALNFFPIGTFVCCQTLGWRQALMKKFTPVCSESRRGADSVKSADTCK